MKFLFKILIRVYIGISVGFTAHSKNRSNIKGESPHSHEAHVHGSGSLAIAFDGSKGVVEFKSAAEGILGFEHMAKSTADKKKRDEVIFKFENEISKFIQFDPILNCFYKKIFIGQVIEAGSGGSGSHSDWSVKYEIICEKVPAGTTLKVDLTEFSGLKDIDITVLVGSIQKSAEYKGKAPVEIKLN